jgi:hypothetical protein
MLLYVKTNTHFLKIIFRPVLRRRNVSDKICTENQSMRCIFSIFSPKLLPVMGYVVQYGKSQAGHRWECNAAHAHCLLDNKRCSCAHKIFNTTIPQSGTAVAQWLKCCATIRKGAGSWHKILSIALWPWGGLSLWQKWVPGVFPGGKGCRCVRLTTTILCRCHEIWET